MTRTHDLRFLAAAVLLLAAAGCSGRSGGAAGGDEHAAVRIGPSPATVGTQLAVALDAPSVSPEQCDIRWKVNGESVGASSQAVLDPDRFRKGDRVEVTVTLPTRGGEAPRTLRAHVTIADAPPVVLTARVSQDVSTGGAELAVSASASDPDGDRTTCEYRWFRNGRPIENASGARLPATSLARGDRITCEVTASDGEFSSVPLMSDAFVLDNRAPRFDAAPTSVPAGDKAFRFQAKAVDPDGDPLHYELTQAPDGMTISADGTIDWPLPAKENRKSEYPVTIRATDGKGGEATQSFTIRLTTGPVAKS